MLRKTIKKLILEQMSKDETSFYGVNAEAISYLLKNPGFFSKLGDENSIEQWCENFIGERMGGGYSRLAFSMRGNNDLVFKVSYIGEEGDLTNQKEIENFTRYNFQNPFFPRVFTSDPSGEWFIVEKLNLLIDDETSIDRAKTLFDPYIRKKIKVLKNIEELLRLSVQGTEDADEKYKLLLGLPGGGFGSIGIDRVAYFYFDAALRRVWDKDVWQFEVVRELEIIDMFDYFQGQHEKVLEEICKKILKDPWMSSFSKIMKSLDIDWGDIGPGNIGIDEQGNIKILDISIFDEKFAGSMFAKSGTPVSWG
tara:strand:- start:3204 stop:4130 length:927 start_codon:yes stop_codon:yes gene_type:complete